MDTGFGQGILALNEFGITIDKSISINGLGADALTLKLINPSDLLGDNVVKIIDETVTASIDGLTITGGYVFTGNGGGIYNAGSLTLDDVTVTGNVAQEFPRVEIAQGGGIYNAGALVTMNSRIIENQGFIGGGLFNAGTATLIRTAVSQNDGNGISNTGDLYLDTVTIAQNVETGNGGGINNSGTVRAIATSILDNTVFFERERTGGFFGGDGAGIYNSGIVELTGSTVANNSAKASGGGIFNSGAGILITTNTTISGNEAIRGGGIYGPATLINTTVAFNRLFEPEFPEFFPDGTPVFAPETIGGGGIANGIYTLINSIVAANSDIESRAPGQESSDIFDVTITADSTGNLLGNGNGGTIDPAASGNQIGNADAPLDPRLDMLEDNGGITLTHALLEGSPAINTGNNNAIPSTITTDQRGNDRLVGPTVDSGAYESELGKGSESGTVPEMNHPIADQLATAYQIYEFRLPSNVFKDTDGDTLSVTATLTNGQTLPRGLTFDTTTQTFRGLLLNPDQQFDISVTATDDDGNQVSDRFTLTSRFPSQPNKIVVLGNDQKNRLVGTAQNEELNGFESNDQVVGRGGNDLLFGGSGRENMNGDAGDDRVYGDSGNDKLFGGSNHDILFGGTGDDRLSGDSGNDSLLGEAGDDRIKGGVGHDVLAGGAGQNYLIGGKGADWFVIEREQGVSTVKDYRPNQDKLALSSDLTIKDLNIVSDNKGNTQIFIDQNLAMILNQVDATSIGSSDIITV